MQYFSEFVARLWIFLSTSEWIGLRKDKDTSIGTSPRRHRMRLEKAS